MSASTRGPRLRLVCVNDVYTLENLPRLRTLVQEAASVDPADVLITTLAGDFVSPSMLSSLDSGRGMVDCMNAVPVTHTIFGNHEDDISPEELHARVKEFAGTWLSTNVIDFDPKLVPVQILEVGPAGGRRVRVGLLGIVMDDRTVYRGAPFGGATLLPANEVALRTMHHLLEQEGCAIVIPITHQSAQEDALLAKAAEPPFPVIVGGHEHAVELEQVGTTWIVKAGSDAVHAVVVDLEWTADAPATSSDRPTVKVALVDVANYAEAPELRARVDGHMRAVHALETATLVHLRPGESLSSVGARARQTSLGTLVCSRLRDALGAEVAVFNGGGIRGNREYTHHFTYGDLKAEVPFDNEVVVAALPGAVLRDAIASSRAKSPIESGGFLQVDDHTIVGEPAHALIRVAGAPFDVEREYRVALVRNLFNGMDHIEPFVAYARDNPAGVPLPGSGREAKQVLVDAFSRALWEELGGFDAVDVNHDGKCDPDEIAAAVARATAEPSSSITVDLILRTLDKDHDRLVSRADAAEALDGGPRRG